MCVRLPVPCGEGQAVVRHLILSQWCFVTSTGTRTLLTAALCLTAESQMMLVQVIAVDDDLAAQTQEEAGATRSHEARPTPRKDAASR